MSNRNKTLMLFVFDIIILYLSLALVISFDFPENFSEYLYFHVDLFSYIFPFWLLIYFIEGLYSLDTYNPANLSLSVLRGTIVSVFISFILIYFIPTDVISITPKTNLILLGLVASLFLLTWRRLFIRYYSRDEMLRETIMIGSQSTLDLAESELNLKPYLGYGIIAALTPEEAEGFDTSLKVKMVAIERNIIRTPALYNHYFSMLGSGIEVVDLARFTEEISGKIPLTSIDESWFVEYCGNRRRSYVTIKNLIDKFVAILIAIIIAPFYLLLLGVLLIAHGRPLFFKQERTGLNNKPFNLYKLRTMVVDAEKSGAQWAQPKDARITKLGSILRKTRMDELPQLLNIIKGEMSIVGPRPERPEIIKNKLSPNIPFYNLRHLVRPGVTGWAQVSFRYGFTEEDSAVKLQYDLYYVKNRNLWLDLIVVLKTIKTVVTGAGQ